MHNRSILHTIPLLPKAELHLHIEGTLTPNLAIELAHKNRITLPYATVAELTEAYSFTNLDSFLALYYACSSVLITQNDFATLMKSYLHKAHTQGIAHAEIFFDPQAHMTRGINLDTVIDGLCEGLDWGYREYGITGGLIMCFLRDRPVSEAEEVLEKVSHRAKDLLGVGLDSSEIGYPPSLFTQVFTRARELGLHCVAHAGEEAGPDYIWQALDLLQAERIDHGVRCLDDATLVEHLRKERIPLTVCPSSNVSLRVVPDWKAHPIEKLIAAGLHVTINSDDPAYFQGLYVSDIYQELLQHFRLETSTLAGLARQSIIGSFAAESRKKTLLTQVDSWLTQVETS